MEFDITNVLFIGNSFTHYNDMPSIFEKLANSNGKNISVRSVATGGRKLIQYSESDVTTETLDVLLTKETFNICFIQEQSLLQAIHFEAFISGLECVVSKEKARPTV